MGHEDGIFSKPEKKSNLTPSNRPKKILLLFLQHKMFYTNVHALHTLHEKSLSANLWM